MGNRKYETEEEARAAHKAQQKAWREAHKGYYTKDKQAERKVKNTKSDGVWGKESFSMPGITLNLCSVQKSNPTSVFIECALTYRYTKDINAIRKLKNDLRAMLKSKLEGQEEYDKKQYIIVIEAYDSSFDVGGKYRNYKSKWKHLTFEFHLRKIRRSFNWVETVTFLEPIVLDIRNNIETLVAENGLELKSAKDSSSIASEPEAS